jgi:hypothetical protein
MSGNIYWNRILGFTPIFTLLVALALYFYNSITYYMGAGRDDTFITLWTGISLAEGHGFVNYNFEPVEMSSSLLHTLIVAVIHIFAPNFIYTINKALGLIAGATLLIVLYQKRHNLFGRNLSGIAPFAITSLGLANNPSWLYWNVGGLETPFQSLIIFLYGIYLVEFWKTPVKILPLVVLQILYLLVRPEGFMLILFTGIFIFARARFHRPLQRRQIILLIGIPGSTFFSILIFRYLNFGLLFPNPVYAKVSLGMNNNIMSSLQAGIQYLIGFYTSSPYVMIQLVILIAFIIHSARILIKQKTNFESDSSTLDFGFMLCLGLILVNHLFVLSTGGDWMEFFRFIVPVVPFLAILTTCFAFRTINSFLEKHNLSKPYFGTVTNLALAVLFLAVIATNSSQRDNYGTQDFHNCSEKIDLSKIHSLALHYSHLDTNLILLNCAGKRDWIGVMPFITDEMPRLYESLNQNITIATFQMGFFPYYVKKVNPAMKIEFIDTLGLTDSNIARMQGPRERYGLSEGTRIVDIFAGQSGELSEYILSRNPNMIYVLKATPIRRMELINLGWTTSWDKPGAVIFIKNRHNTKIP